MKKKTRTQNPRRYRGLRGDASIDAARLAVAETLNLPIDSIHLVLPTGRRANYSTTVAALREWWDSGCE